MTRASHLEACMRPVCVGPKNQPHSALGRKHIESPTSAPAASYGFHASYVSPQSELKIQWGLTPVRVRIPPSALFNILHAAELRISRAGAAE